MGMLRAKIRPVVVFPNSGCPEESSKTEPTPAIADMQHKSRQIPLLTVIGVTLNSFPKNCLLIILSS
jgi:hypothetical protein